MKKREIKNYLKSGILLLGISLLLWNCDKEDPISLSSDNEQKLEYSKKANQNEQKLILPAKSWFENNIILEDFIILEFTEIINWKDAIVSNFKNEYSIEVPLILKNNITTTFRKNKDYKSHHRLLLVTNDFVSYKISHVQIVTKNKTFKNNDKDFNYFSIKPGFNGYIAVIDDFKNVNLKKYKQGIKISSPKHELMAKEDVVSCTYLVWSYDDGGYEIITLLYCTTQSDQGSNDYGSGSGGGGSYNEINSFLNQNVWDTQDPYDDWNKLTDCEKDYFATNPSFLFNAKINKTFAENAARELFPNCSPHNTVVDAFRHSYFAALNTQNMGYLNAKTLGDAHECETIADELPEKEMDLHNNSWGYNYAGTHSYFTKDLFYTAFINANNNGEIHILTNCN